MRNKVNWRKSVFIVAAIFFIFIIFLPAVFILSNILHGGASLNWQIFKAVLISFFIGLAVLLIDLAFGLPLAWVLARSRSKIARLVDSLIDLSLVMPTAALGF
jgi:ABC-type sulfate transport system permease component